MMSKVIFLLPLQWCAQSLKLQQQEVSQCKVMWRGSCLGEVSEGVMLTEQGGSFMHSSARFNKALLAEEGISLPALATKDGISCGSGCQLVLAQRTKVNMLILGTPTGSGRPDTTDWTEKTNAKFLGGALPQTYLWVREYDAGTYVFTGRAWYLFEPQASGSAHSKGDPHLKNVKGDKFDVKRQGSAPLLKISGDSDGDALLQIMGRIQGASKCAKVTMITALNISGSWLEKNVEVKVGDQSDEALHVTVDGQQVWSAGPNAPEYKDRMDWSAPHNSPDYYKRNFVFNHEADKFYVEELDTSKTAKTDPGIQIAMSSNPNLILKINRPMRHVASVPHLNLDVQGLGRVSPSLKVGGLLGTDDHSNWIHQSEECKNFAITFKSEESTILDGSIATASY